MKKIVVLGSGCSNCKKTYELISKKVKELGVEVEVVKDEEITSLLKYGVMATPAVVIDDKIVLVGAVPTEKDVEGWFKPQTSCSCGGCC